MKGTYEKEYKTHKYDWFWIQLYKENKFADLKFEKYIVNPYPLVNSRLFNQLQNSTTLPTVLICNMGIRLSYRCHKPKMVRIRICILQQQSCILAIAWSVDK